MHALCYAYIPAGEDSGLWICRPWPSRKGPCFVTIIHAGQGCGLTRAQILVFRNHWPKRLEIFQSGVFGKTKSFCFKKIIYYIIRRQNLILGWKTLHKKQALFHQSWNLTFRPLKIIPKEYIYNSWWKNRLQLFLCSKKEVGAFTVLRRLQATYISTLGIVSAKESFLTRNRRYTSVA